MIELIPANSPIYSFPDSQVQQGKGKSSVETSVIVPAYNEEEALPSVLLALLSALDETYEIIVVDDGSEDQTSAIAGAYPVQLIIHPQNSGKGAAMKTGIAKARGQKIIFIDADATYPVEEIPTIAQSLNRFDLVRGIRMQGREHMPALNRVGNKIFELAIRFVHQGDSNDALSGLYGLRADALKRMRLDSNGFDIESEIVIKAGAMQLRTSNVPIQYYERIGAKKLNAVRDGLRILRRVLALAIMYKPFVTFVLPGVGLWLLGLLGVALLATGPVGGFTTNTYVFSAMAFLAGFQLIVFGMIVNLYAVETGIGVPSRSLNAIATRIPSVAGAMVSQIMILVGIVWSVLLVLQWVQGGFGAFHKTEALVSAMTLVVWGGQVICTMFIFSLFSGSSEQSNQDGSEHDQG